MTTWHKKEWQLIPSLPDEVDLAVGGNPKHYMVMFHAPTACRWGREASSSARVPGAWVAGIPIPVALRVWDGMPSTVFETDKHVVQFHDCLIERVGEMRI